MSTKASKQRQIRKLNERKSWGRGKGKKRALHSFAGNPGLAYVMLNLLYKTFLWIGCDDNQVIYSWEENTNL